MKTASFKECNSTVSCNGFCTLVGAFRKKWFYIGSSVRDTQFPRGFFLLGKELCNIPTNQGGKGLVGELFTSA